MSISLKAKKNLGNKKNQRGSGALLDAFEQYDLQEDNNMADDQYDELLRDSQNYKKARANYDFEDDPKYQGVKVSKNSLYQSSKTSGKRQFIDREISEDESIESVDSIVEEEEESQVKEKAKDSLNNLNVDKFLEEIDEQDQEIITSKKDRQKELKKAKAVKHQQALLDIVFESRVKMQDTLKLANRLPYAPTLSSLAKIDASKEVRKGLKELEVEVVDLIDLLGDITHEYHSKSESNCTLAKDKRLFECQKTLKEDNVSTKDFVTSYRFNTEEIWKTIDESFEAQFSYIDTTISTWAQKFNMLNQNSIKGRFANIYQTPTQQAQKAMEDFDRLVKRSQIKDLSVQPLFNLGEASADYDQEIYNDEDFYLTIFREMLQKQAQSDVQNSGNGEFLFENTQLYLKSRQLKAKPKKEVDRRASKNRKIRYDVHPKLLNFVAPTENTVLLAGRDHILKNLFGLYEKEQNNPVEETQKKKGGLRKKVKKNPEDNEGVINLL